MANLISLAIHESRVVAQGQASLAERLRLEREERRQRLCEGIAEPLSAELQERVDALNRRLAFAGNRF